MFYYNTVTKEYPRHIGDLKLLGWKEGQQLPENWVIVQDVTMPELNANQIAEMTEPALIDGSWTVSFEIRDMTELEIAKQEEFTQDLLIKINNPN